MGCLCPPDQGHRMGELLDTLRRLRAVDEKLVVLHTARLPRLSAREQRRTVATIRGLSRSIRATEKSIRKVERVIKRELR